MRLAPHLAPLAALALLALTPWTAEAQDAPTLLILEEKFEGDVPGKVKTALQAALPKALQEDKRKPKVLGVKETREALLASNPALAGCFDEGCLKRVGEVLKSPVAVRTLISGESQIYDYQIWFYDLSSGKVALNEKVTCEVCTGDEATQLYTRSLKDSLQRLTFAATPSEPPKQDPPKQEPPKKDPPKQDPPKVVSGPRVTLKVAADPPSALLELGDLPLGTGKASAEVKPGVYKVRARAEGFETREVEVQLDEGGQGPSLVFLQLVPQRAEGEKEAPREQPAPATQEARSPALFGLGWGLVGLGVGGVVGGSYLLGLDGDTTCSTGEVWQCPRVFNTTFEGSMLLGAGAISLTSGVFLIVDNWGGEAAQPSQPSGATLQLAPTPGGGLVGLSTRF
jgi:hypothetical protein